MPVQLGTKLAVQGFGYVGDENSKRLVGPRVEAHDLAGSAGSLQYGVADLLLDKVEGRLDVTQWTAEAASLGGAWLRDAAGRLDAAVDRIEMPNGMTLTRAAKGVEILSPHFTLSEVKLTVHNPRPGAVAPVAPAPAAPGGLRREVVPPKRAAPPPDPAHLRQERLRFLDSLAGHVDLTVKVSLHLPVIGTRTLDQALDVPIADGSLDYRALEDQLNWLEGRFLDMKHTGDRLAVTWRVPIFGSKHELLAWLLDSEAATLASLGRVPVRSFADYELPARDDDDDEPAERGDGLLRALTLDAIDIALSLLAPRSLDIGGGTIAFGGDGQPGMVDLKVTGRVSKDGPGALSGSIGELDTTIKDLKLGGVVMSADRLSIDGIDALHVEFDGFRPVTASMVIHRITATNLVVKIGS